MAVLYSGKLLVKVRGRPFSVFLAGAQALSIPGHTLEALFKAHNASPHFRATQTQPGDHWLLATPRQGSNEHPWDAAHRVASHSNYSIYVEPDLLQEAASPPEATAQTGLNQDWPPYVSVSPGWHLADAFAGFEGVRGLATGNGVRIAHLDTGYWPPHDSTPRLVKRGLGYNFYENNHNTTDPGLGGSLRQPGHGTATIAILAGNTVDLFFQGMQYKEEEISGEHRMRKLYR